MNKKIKDETGKKYKNLTVIKYLPHIKGYATYECICLCGNITITTGKNLRSGNSTSCGCSREKKIILKKTDNKKGYSFILAKCGKKIKIDSCFYRYLNQFKWRVCNNYAVRSGIKKADKTKNVFMHHEVLPIKNNLSIDHIDGNSLNNCKSNLRLCTQRQNLMNKSVNKNKKSGIPYKGVYKQRNRYVAQIMGNHIGSFATSLDAAKAYNKQAIKLYGEFARLNNV